MFEMKEQKRLIFDTKKSALDYLWSNEKLTTNIEGKIFWPRGTYYLSHGEYSQPQYSPRRYKDGWGIHVEHFYYSGALYAPEDGRVEWDIWAE